MDDEQKVNQEQEIVDTPRTYTQDEVDALQAAWSTERDKLSNAVEQAKQEIESQRIKYEFTAAAKERGYSDPSKIMEYINLSSVKIEEDGHILGIDEMLDAISAVKVRQVPKTIGDPIPAAQKQNVKDTQLSQAAERARSGNPNDMAAYSKIKRLLGGN